jgi:heme-degrading monooxygenase HmoA
MYARYTEFQFDAPSRDAVMVFWRTVAVPSASRQPGWRAAYILESDETAGVLRTVTLWDAPEDFQRYYTSDEHQVLGAGIKGSGLRGVARDGLQARFAATAAGPLFRITRAVFPPERSVAVETFWRETGRPMMLAAEGCLRAEAFWAAPGAFTMVAEWRSQEHATAFLTGPDHGSFGAAMDALGSQIAERIVGDRIA